jgi:hypothetical protein
MSRQDYDDSGGLTAIQYSPSGQAWPQLQKSCSSLGAWKEEKLAREAKSTDRQVLGKDFVVASAIVYIAGRNTSMFCFVGSALRNGA